MIKLAIIDDHDMFREGLVHLIEKNTNYSILYHTGKSMECIRHLNNEVFAQIYLVDLNIPDLNGMELLSVIRKYDKHAKCIMISGDYKASNVRRLIDLGACSFISKESSIEELVFALDSVERNDFYLQPNILKLISGMKYENYNDLLTRRELDVLQLICQEKSSNEIAEELLISTRTVEVHRKHLIEKTNSKNVVGLVLYAMNNGVLD